MLTSKAAMLGSQKFFIIILVMFLVACATEDKQDQKNKANLHLQIGTSHLMKGQYPQALRELLNAERFDPKNPIVQNNLGLAYMVREKYVEAEKKFLLALRLDPNYTDARNNIGRLLIDLGLYDKALVQLQLATSDLTYEAPEKSWGNLGQALFLKGEYAKAREALRKSLSFRKENCFSLNMYGRTLLELQAYKEASASFDLAIKQCVPANAEEPYFYSAMALYKMGRLDLARARFTEVVSLYPSSTYAKKANDLLEIIK